VRLEEQPPPAARTGARLVGRDELEERLARVRALVRDPRAGLFGPGSRVWAINKHAVTFVGAGRAALLQLAHPFVAHGVDEHSATRHDPVGRFQRTFARVFAMVYGDLDSALDAARAVHRIHEQVTGEIPRSAGPFPAGAPYHANVPEALLWVHATLWDTSLLVHELVLGRLDDAVKAQYYEETKRFAWLFGIPDDVLPPDWPSFSAYVARMLAGDTLAVTREAASMGSFLFEPLYPLTGALTRRSALVTAWLLPEHLARGFGLDRGGERGRAAFERTITYLRWVVPRLPRRLRYLPPYVEARRRLAGRTDRDLVGELLGRAFVGAR
jgi:uncharacterized protein (DUF2236 family)